MKTLSCSRKSEKAVVLSTGLLGTTDSLSRKAWNSCCNSSTDRHHNDSMKSMRLVGSSVWLDGCFIGIDSLLLNKLWT